jgi:hypothetical protein
MTHSDGQNCVNLATTTSTAASGAQQQHSNSIRDYQSVPFLKLISSFIIYG